MCVGLTTASSCAPGCRTVHPHVRGAHGPLTIGVDVARGPSPRAWGSPVAGLWEVSAVRSIPTCVGLTGTQCNPQFGTAVHPHVRGAHDQSLNAKPSSNGPSPRAWGSQLALGGHMVAGRSIPTCVGLTARHHKRHNLKAVHPHVRGAHSASMAARALAPGPSPRAWGSPLRQGLHVGRVRSIPTCVGLTRRVTSPEGEPPVHPHVRGAHSSSAITGNCFVGPSPRAWGSPTRHPGGDPSPRSIPTCVGLTTEPHQPSDPPPVHPHVRGAHLAWYVTMTGADGPSPRAWGSPPCWDGCPQQFRSIPTCVGLTGRGESPQSRRSVHPHVRGAHLASGVRYVWQAGPSPRAWGSHDKSRLLAASWRSIPTCVGLTQGAACAG